MSSLPAELVILSILVLINGAFSMAEIALVSSRKAKLRLEAESGNAGAERALSLAEEPGSFLSTIQIGITLVGILSGAYGGATVAKSLSAYLEQYPALRPYSDTLSLTLVVLAITYLSLVLGELVPKRLALLKAERIAALVARPIYYLSLAAYPLAWILDVSTEALLKLMNIKKSASSVSEEEVKVLLEEGTEAGIFHAMEHEICHRAFHIDDLGVKDIMTPRPDILWLDAAKPFAHNLEIIRTGDHTCFPVGRGGLDQVIGFLHLKDLLKQGASPENGDPDLLPLLRKPLYFPETISAWQVLEQFKIAPIHMAMVVDEYGIIQGLVTVSDVIETIVGDIPSLSEGEDSDIVRREDGSWLVDGALSIDDFKAHFKIQKLPGEVRGDFHTLAGFVMSYLERIPATGDRFQWGDWRFEIVDMDGRRIDKVLVSGPPGAS
ncbi:MAG: hemolysin family protein [Pseudomonadota bacterium]|nr:hemolysin family protein [Pseudomonadota bacterium]